jgi:hypothetical protein
VSSAEVVPEWLDTHSGEEAAADACPGEEGTRVGAIKG